MSFHIKSYSIEQSKKENNFHLWMIQYNDFPWYAITQDRQFFSLLSKVVCMVKFQNVLFVLLVQSYNEFEMVMEQVTSLLKEPTVKENKRKYQYMLIVKESYLCRYLLRELCIHHTTQLLNELLCPTKNFLLHMLTQF
jgi:hypothetical protein